MEVTTVGKILKSLIHGYPLDIIDLITTECTSIKLYDADDKEQLELITYLDKHIKYDLIHLLLKKGYKFVPYINKIDIETIDVGEIKNNVKKILGCVLENKNIIQLNKLKLIENNYHYIVRNIIESLTDNSNFIKNLNTTHDQYIKPIEVVEEQVYSKYIDDGEGGYYTEKYKIYHMNLLEIACQNNYHDLVILLLHFGVLNDAIKSYKIIKKYFEENAEIKKSDRSDDLENIETLIEFYLLTRSHNVTIGYRGIEYSYIEFDYILHCMAKKRYDLAKLLLLNGYDIYRKQQKDCFSFGLGFGGNYELCNEFEKF